MAARVVEVDDARGFVQLDGGGNRDGGLGARHLAVGVDLKGRVRRGHRRQADVGLGQRVVRRDHRRRIGERMGGGGHAFLERTPHRRGLGGLVPIGDLLARGHARQSDTLDDTRARRGGRDRRNTDHSLAVTAGLHSSAGLRDPHDGRRHRRLRRRGSLQIGGFRRGRSLQVSGLGRGRIAQLAGRTLSALGAHALKPGRRRRRNGRHRVSPFDARAREALVGARRRRAALTLIVRAQPLRAVGVLSRGGQVEEAQLPDLHAGV